MGRRFETAAPGNSTNRLSGSVTKRSQRYRALQRWKNPRFGIHVLVGALAIAAALYLTVCMSSSAYAQAGVPWILGRVDQEFVWSPRVNVVPAIDACAVKMHAESPEQACLLQRCAQGGASSKAIAFTRWYYTFSEGDSAFIDRVVKPRFGAVSIAQIELPGRANTNWIYTFVNGMPAVINPEEAFTTKLPWTKNAAFLALKKAHPNAGVLAQVSASPHGPAAGSGLRSLHLLSMVVTHARASESCISVSTLARSAQQRNGHDRRSSLSIFQRPLQVVVGATTVPQVSWRAQKIN